MADEPNSNSGGLGAQSGNGDNGAAPGGQVIVPGPNAEPAATSAAPAAIAAGNGEVGQGAVSGSLQEKDPGMGQEGSLPEIKKVGKKNFAAVFIEGKDGAAGTVAPLSDQEAIVLRTFIKTRDYAATAKEAGGITVDSVKRMLRRPALKSCLLEAIRRAVVMEHVDLSWTVKEMVDVWEGAKKVDSTQVAMIREIVKIVNPTVPRSGPMVVVQQNNSVYSGKSKEVIDADWADARRTATEGL